MRIRSNAATLLSWFALALIVVAGAFWQSYERVHQQIVIGGALDDGAIVDFQERERSTFLGDLPFRWSQPQSYLRFWNPAAPTRLTLHMIAPSVAGFTQHLALQTGSIPLGDFLVAREQRRYQLLLPDTHPRGDLLIQLASDRFPGDTRRELGLVFTAAALIDLDNSPWGAPIAELWLMPLVPLTLLLCALSVRQMQGHSAQWRNISSVAIPLLVLGMLMLGNQIFVGMGLLLAEYALCIILVIGAIQGFCWLLRRFPQLRPADDQRAQRWLILTFLIGLAFTFSPSMRSDGVGYYVYLRSLALDGDLHFDNEFDALWPAYKPGDVPTMPTGYMANPWSVGPAFWWAPGFGLAHAFVLASQPFGAPWQANGYDQPYIVMIALTSAFAGLATMLICYRICRRWVAPPIATLAVISLVFGSNLLYYMMRWGCYAHAIAAMLASLFVLAWLRLEERPGFWRWLMVGMAAGAMLQSYWVSGLTVILPMLTFARLLLAALQGPRGQRARAIRQLVFGSAAAAAMALLIFSPQMLAWQIIYGSALTVPQGNGFATPGPSRIVAMLVGQPFGLLLWTPALFLGMFGLLLLWRSSAWQTACLVLSLALYFWYNSTIPDWHGSGGFGLRRLSLLAPWCVIGLALLYQKLSRRHAALPMILAALMGGWMLMLMVRLDHDLIPFRAEVLEQRPFVELFLSRNALPLWDVPKLLLGSHFADQIRQINAPFIASYLIILILVIAVTCWAVMRIFSLRATPETDQITRVSHLPHPPV